ncbi:glycoside hydrolase family 32 protein [Aquibacillus albus]|uniref:Sucrose-6-phosphate hydrolase n=1 Tax=Aquibacillus albus TaxID=1168171 RepID=A0ABS2N352_9BACI|nr:sucrose-6-phosphate hydrolase [Aquibacillus albus]MBM7572570.1 beta-fructofuranosidase [Aquibacillus albus]
MKEFGKKALTLNIERDRFLKEQAMERLEKYRETTSQDPFRMQYHMIPPVGLLNDPNGFIYYKGEYHLFFQWNPFETKHGPKFWGHYSSTNLVDWQLQPIALAPSDWFDKNGCYSGSAVEHEGKLYLFYTGNVRDENGDRESYQCLAVSADGVHFEKKGPVISVPKGYTAHFRDPKVWKENNRWYMVIGAQTEEEQGCVVLYGSDDLEQWEFIGRLAGTSQSNEESFGYMWECPDLFSLGDKDVLLFSPQGIPADGYHYNNIYQSGYFVGKANLDKGTFEHQEFVELDQGFDFYAPQTTLDSGQRRLMFGWMGVPEENEAFHPTLEYEWIHAMTIPRELKLVDGCVYQSPVEELKQLRENAVEYKEVTIRNQFELDNVGKLAFELMVDILSNSSKQFTIWLGKYTRVIFNQAKNRLTFERKSIKTNEIEARHYKIEKIDKLHLFIDASSVEMFVNNGAKVFTSRIFEHPDNRKVTFEVSDAMTIDVFTWDLRGQ